MGTDINPINEENLAKNLDFYSEINTKKETILFSSEKEQKDQSKENQNKNFSLIEELNKSTKINSILETNKEKVKFTFKWKQDLVCNNKSFEVLLVGTFLNNWNNFVVMEKNNKNQIYEYDIYLSRKIHYFKFIVNNKWLCSDLYPTKLDENNNLNNWIDLTNYKENESDNLFEDSTELIKTISDQESLIKYPELKILNMKPPRIINNKKLFSISNNDNYKNDSYQKIFKLSSDKNCHLMTEITDFFCEENCYKISSTERRENKFVTIVYYRPK